MRPVLEQNGAMSFASCCARLGGYSADVGVALLKASNGFMNAGSVRARAGDACNRGKRGAHGPGLVEVHAMRAGCYVRAMSCDFSKVCNVVVLVPRH